MDTNGNLQTYDLNRLIEHHLRFTLAKPRAALGKHDWYRATAFAVRDLLVDRMLATRTRVERQNPKRLYYLSVEFLIGRSLENSLHSLGVVESCRAILAQHGVDLQALFDEEPDAALGNGGLGRLAACFLDSIATLDMPGYGYGINYEFGLFRQEIRDGFQIEQPDAWQREASPWLIPRPEESCLVPVYGHVDHDSFKDGDYRPRWNDKSFLVGMPFDLPIVGYGGRTVNFVRLFAARATDEFDVGTFNSGDYIKAVEQKLFSENLTKILYPSDAVQAGRELRLLQEYFFVACAIRDIVGGFVRRGEDWSDFPAKVAIQLNDTHPALAIAELMRLLIDERGLSWAVAWEYTRAAVAYTNHTLMPEALERWPMGLLERVVPRHLQIILEINHRFLDAAALIWSGGGDKLRRASIVDDHNGREVRMAHLAIVGSHSINGVSALHTELVKTRLVPEFHELWPERFNNKTNGVTQRRWLLMANPGLAKLLTLAIGDSWITGLDNLEAVERFAEDEAFHFEFAIVKRANKERMATTIHRLLGIDPDPASLFDVQAKRIHEYKRQLLMALGIMHQYLSLVDDHLDPPIPRTYVIAGKAAPGYWAAKMMIKLINCLAETINEDPRTHGLIKVAFVPDYRVSLAEKIIPAADLSEQISTAGREASGTGNMKFAMNGALTIGTLDGANIEIQEAVGAENMFVFGLTAPQIEELIARREYRPRDYYEQDSRIRRVLDELAAGRFCQNDPGLFRWVRDSLLGHDEYFVLADFAAYVEMQDRVSREYAERRGWTKKAILNVARIGRFSSDRTIREYARDIWDLKALA
ncbi:MAG TPA: glycogen/starch/alpha-glucan phosphorylase [Candidatus Binataceae bacterium]|nr:glycogen/starch/alpha-glucan phosphorylase [Candidatus Binataceae bacterium]